MNYNLILSLLTITTNLTLISSVKMSRSIASQIKHAFIVAAGIVSILVVILANNFKLVMLAISIALIYPLQPAKISKHIQLFIENAFCTSKEMPGINL